MLFKKITTALLLLSTVCLFAQKPEMKLKTKMPVADTSFWAIGQLVRAQGAMYHCAVLHLDGKCSWELDKKFLNPFYTSPLIEPKYDTTPTPLVIKGNKVYRMDSTNTIIIRVIEKDVFQGQFPPRIMETRYRNTIIGRGLLFGEDSVTQFLKGVSNPPLPTGIWSSGLSEPLPFEMKGNNSVLVGAVSYGRGITTGLGNTYIGTDTTLLKRKQ